MAVRLGWNRLHLAGATGRGYRAACGRVLTADVDVDVVVYTGRDVGRAWRLEVVCLDCDRRLGTALARRRRRR